MAEHPTVSRACVHCVQDVGGLCPQVKPPGFSQFYPSLPHWLAQRRQKRETLGEELRLLYVALTRAVHSLYLIIAPSKKNEKKIPYTFAGVLGSPPNHDM